MNQLNHEQLVAFEQKIQKQQDDITQLTANSFDVSNSEHLVALKKYINHFELNVNRMYLFRAMSIGTETLLASLVITRVLPLPQAFHYLFSSCLYLGVAGHILQRLSMTDFYQEKKNIERIYNWCLKDNKSDLEITNNMNNSDIQRLIKLLAPFCSIEQVRAWHPPQNAKKNQNSWSPGYLLLSNSINLFYQQRQTSVDIGKINEIKHKVESRGYDLDVFNGLSQALQYFSGNSDFRDLLTSQFSNPLILLEPFIPSIITAFAKK